MRLIDLIIYHLLDSLFIISTGNKNYEDISFIEHVKNQTKLSKIKVVNS